MLRVLSQLVSDNVLAHPSVHIFSWVLKTNFKWQIFYFLVYGKMVEENILYQQLQKICREKFVALIFFE